MTEITAIVKTVLVTMEDFQVLSFEFGKSP